MDSKGKCVIKYLGFHVYAHYVLDHGLKVGVDDYSAV
jgi:hypothetical protein